MSALEVYSLMRTYAVEAGQTVKVFLVESAPIVKERIFVLIDELPFDRALKATRI